MQCAGAGPTLITLGENIAAVAGCQAGGGRRASPVLCLVLVLLFTYWVVSNMYSCVASWASKLSEYGTMDFIHYYFSNRLALAIPPSPPRALLYWVQF
jgi:hypothetical protein